MISYAQNFEDVILFRALKDVTDGFYIDIGAQHPTLESVSLAFHEAGWRGVHVEPSPAYAQALQAARPGDEVIEAAVGAADGRMEFFEFPDTGLSTGVKDIAERHRGIGFRDRAIEVSTLPLSALLDRYADRDIHWLKIDCEGMEAEVLSSWAPSPVRPWIVVVESTAPLNQEPTYQEWEPTLHALGYAFAYSDGLNRFYVSEARKELLDVFGPPPNCFDGYQLSAVTQGFRLLSQETAARRALLGELNARIEDAEGELRTREEARWDDLFARLEAIDRASGELETAAARLSSAEQALKMEGSRRALAERLLADAEARLGETAARADALAVDLENHRQAVAHLERAVAERDAELHKVQADPLWRLSRRWARTKKKIARGRRALLVRAGLAQRPLKPAAPAPLGAHDMSRTVVGPRPLLLRRADEIARQLTETQDAQVQPQAAGEPS